ncbi:hypothetical protein B4109_1254 [Geobacillus stearothermophilus]|uniref:Uncharacterized protein n=1 Tax=Geobacillus stearothermophilus TaxID=1422 RepID=A0A150MRG4_GEOSE|nr:hypothetical protein B4109_1254 [Geobacillus stearothermophilus]
MTVFTTIAAPLSSFAISYFDSSVHYSIFLRAFKNRDFWTR